jgi:hypothetical protein
MMPQKSDICLDYICPLFAFPTSQTEGKSLETIRHHCQWCMENNPTTLCLTHDNSIYQYRVEVNSDCKDVEDLGRIL